MRARPSLLSTPNHQPSTFCGSRQFSSRFLLLTVNCLLSTILNAKTNSRHAQLEHESVFAKPVNSLVQCSLPKVGRVGVGSGLRRVAREGPPPNLLHLGGGRRSRDGVQYLMRVEIL